MVLISLSCVCVCEGEKGGELLLLYLHALRACITPTAPTFQGSLARPACMVALLTLRALLQGSLARPACRAALLTLLTL